MITSALCGTFSKSPLTRQEFLEHLSRTGGHISL
jgi:GTP cyclohydrolase I